MLGSYEDVNNPYPFTMEPLPIPTNVTFPQSDQGQPNTDKPSKPPFHNQVHHTSTQSENAPSSNGYSSQPVRTTAASPSPNGHSSASSSASLTHGQLDHSAHQQKKSDARSELRERVSLPQEVSSQSPDDKPPPFPHSSDHENTDMDTKDAFDRHQGSTDHPSESAMDVSTVNLKQSPKDASLPQANKGNALPSQTSLLSSKQPSVVMTQKPTAYVRPMDGQDQVVSESPELKPSPEPYVALPELINKSELGKTKILPPFLEVSILFRSDKCHQISWLLEPWCCFVTFLYRATLSVSLSAVFMRSCTNQLQTVAWYFHIGLISLTAKKQMRKLAKMSNCSMNSIWGRISALNLTPFQSRLIMGLWEMVFHKSCYYRKKCIAVR